jgi:hypothetical protein
MSADQSGGSPGAETPPTPVSREGGTDPFANLPHAVKAIRFDNVWAHGVISSAIISLQQQLADAELTARYQSDVSRQADEAREKAEAENAGQRENAERWQYVRQFLTVTRWEMTGHASLDDVFFKVPHFPRADATVEEIVDFARATPTPPQERP